jgi:SAM-dependent methyltransferase
MNSSARCILCGGSLSSGPLLAGYRWRDQSFWFRQCRDCGSSVVDPLPSEEQLTEIYRQDQYHDVHCADVDDEITPTAWSDIVPMLGRVARLLDFGCGNGTFLKQAASSGFEAVGVELDPLARERAARNSGCPVLSQDELKSRVQRFDVIHLGDVLEHLPAPVSMLRQLEELLAEGGLFFIEGPLEENASLVRLCNRLFTHVKSAVGKELLSSNPPTHLSRTSARSQRRFFHETMGYELLFFAVSETGWPYLTAASDGDSKFRPAAALRSMIGRAAVMAAGLNPILRLQLGNRFAALLSPAHRQSQKN